MKKVQKDNLYIVPLGGLGEVGRNMNLFIYKGKILIVDMGLRMPEENMPGIDYIIPNTSIFKPNLENTKVSQFSCLNPKNIVGVILTHGHYDHIGAIPYTIPRLQNPIIFASNLTKGIVLNRQIEFSRQPKLIIEEVKNGSKISLGPFNIEFFRQNHNIPGNLGLFIETPVGNILYTSDFKFDPAPINDLPTDFSKFESFAKRKILLLISDSTGAENKGRSLSEKTISENLEEIFKQAPGRIIAATFASHLNRIQQIISLSEKYQRKVVIEGLSMKKNVEIARNLNYLKIKKGTIIKAEDISKFPDEKITFCCTGAQGEKSAALMRIASGEHRFLNIKKGDAIIFSSSVIPGNERTVQIIKDEFYRQGVKVYHYQMMDIHASGHAYSDELKKLIQILKPKFLLPIHGQYSMLVRHKELAEEEKMAPSNIIIAENGQVLSLNPQSFVIEKERVASNYVMVDGLGVGDVGEVVLRDRQNLAQDGMFVIVAVIDRITGKVKTSPDIISRGFVYLRESKQLLKETRQQVIKIVEDAIGAGGAVNWSYVKDELRDKIGQFLFYKTKRRPMILPVVIEV